MLLSPWDSPGRNTGVGCHAILQGIFPTQGSNLSLLSLLQIGRRVFYQAPPGKPYLPTQIPFFFSSDVLLLKQYSMKYVGLSCPTVQYEGSGGLEDFGP